MIEGVKLFSNLFYTYIIELFMELISQFTGALFDCLTGKTEKEKGEKNEDVLKKCFLMMTYILTSSIHTRLY